MAQRRTPPCRLRLGIEPLEPRWALSGTGLTAQYFHNADFTGLAETRTEAVDYNWGTASPAPGVHADSFSVRWTGQVIPQFSQQYTFSVLSDEGVRVWVDGQMLIDDWTPHSRRSAQGTIALQAGQAYDIRVDYFEGSGNAQIQLFWSSASQPAQVIPASSLYESPSGLLGTYTDGTGGNLSRVDATVDFDWQLGTPHAAIDADGFKVSWTGQLRAGYSDAYTFSTISDDGVRLWIGNELVIDNWTLHAATEDQGTKQLEAGKWYDVRLEYFDNTGFAEMELRWSSLRQTGDGVFEVIPQTSLRATKHALVTFKNPLGIGADPFVIQWQGNYYMTMTTNGESVSISRAASLQDIHSSSPGTSSVLAWSAPNGTNYSDQVWAPELHRIGDSWYIYVAASNGDNATHRMHVLQRNAPDPFGPFTYVAQMAIPTDRWAIDGTAFEWQGTQYFVWSGWPGNSDGQQNLYIAEMRNPWTILGDRVLLSSPQYAWEMHGMPINEGPQILINNGQLHIIYSASGFWTPNYALGRLTYNGTGSILNPASWTKASQPVFQSANGVVGVGHASFTKSPDGTEDWIVYHAHRNPTPPPKQELRDVRIQPFTYFANGTPNFGSPLPLNQTIAAPSVGPDPERLFVVGDYNADGIVDAADQIVWRATFGSTLFNGTSADGDGTGDISAADYVLWRKQATAGAGSLSGSGGTAQYADAQPLTVALPAVESSANAFTAEESASGIEQSQVVSTATVANPVFYTRTANKRTAPQLTATAAVAAPEHDLALAAWLAATRLENRDAFDDDLTNIATSDEMDAGFAIFEQDSEFFQSAVLTGAFSELAASPID